MAQKHAAIWYFGNEAGLDFNNCDPIALTDGQLNQLEGCASIADSSGNLLFYTDGIEVYNASHDVMPNGTDLWGNPSSSQSAIIVPSPGDDSIYYVFTVDNNAGSNGLAYSVVDIDLDGGLGDVVVNKKNIQLKTPAAEKLTAVYHANGEDIWVIAHEMGNNNFLAFLVSGSGVNPTPIISSVGEVLITTINGLAAIGCLKASPDGTKLANANGYHNRGVELFDFDNVTGKISNPQKINNYSSYGVEFSPNSQLLYVTSMVFDGPILQYDISLPNLSSIQQSETLIASDYKYGTLQLAINGKIYASQIDFGAAWPSETISVINNPNKVGIACDFQGGVVGLAGKHTGYGLPPFIQSYFQYEISFKNLCFGTETQFEVLSFSNSNNVTWNFGDPNSGSSNTATGATATHIFSAPDTYTVTANLVSSVNCPITLTQKITIYPLPELNQPENLVQCDVEVFDLTQIVPEMLGPDQNSTDFTITYYEIQTDAEAGIPGTEIQNPGAYSIETLPQQTVYVRVENEYGCFDTTSFDIIVNPKAEVDISAYDGMAICVDLDPDTSVIGGNYEPIMIDTELSETEYLFQWTLDGNTLPETGSSILADVPGEYTVTVTDITSTDPSCSTTAAATIIESNPPEFDVEAVFFEGQIIISNVSGNGDYEFSTDQVSWMDLGENTSLTLKVKNTGLVTVYGHDKNGCGTTVVEVWMIDYMKFFTPNGDGINDRWNILGLQQQSTANLYIFDRFGKLLKTLDPAGPGWDGTYNGRRMPSNDYWFRLEYISSEGTPKVFQANFTLKR